MSWPADTTAGMTTGRAKPSGRLPLGTGNVGRHALRAIADHSYLDLIGVVHDQAKAGADAGTL
jgi:hypothetical protein